MSAAPWWRPRWVFERGAGAYDLLTSQALWRYAAGRLAPPLPPGPRWVLDLGCGPGASVLALAEALGPEARILGLDVARAMLRRAAARREREPAGARVRLVAGDAGRLPLPSASVDLVTGHSVLYLLPDRERALSEARRVLRPGGWLALMEPARDLAPGRLLGSAWRARELVRRHPADALRMATAMVAWRCYSGAAGQFGPGQLVALCRAAGFEEVDCQPTLGGLGLRCLARAGASR